MAFPSAYSLLMLGGMAAGYLCTRLRAVRAGVAGEFIDMLAPLSALAGLAGAAAVGPLVGGGRTILGGLIFGTAAAVWYGRRKRVPLGVLGDAAAPGLMMGEAVGRLGCLAAGCCGGVGGVPVQMIEAAGCVVIAAVVMAGGSPRRPGVPGERFLAAGMAYGFLRMALEHWRMDAAAAGPLSEGQWVAGGMVLACAATWAVRRRRYGGAKALAGAGAL